LEDLAIRVVSIARPGFDLPMGTDFWTNLYADLSIGHTFEAWVRVRRAQRCRCWSRR
jgi:hypothetical protein